jgi:hypothetical protein
MLLTAWPPSSRPKPTRSDGSCAAAGERRGYGGGHGPLPAPAPGIVTPDLAAALGGDGAARSARELTHNAGNQATGGIWRVRGPAGRAVVKLATAAGGGDRAWATSDRRHHWNSWRREVLAYQSGFAESVYGDAGLGAPRLLAVVEPRPGVVALWLEDVAGLPGARWPVSRLAGFAERLGRAQAGWAGRDPAHPVAVAALAAPVRGQQADPRAGAVGSPAGGGRLAGRGPGGAPAAVGAARPVAGHRRGPPSDHLPPGRLADEPDRPRQAPATRSCCWTGRSPERERSARTSAT